MIEKDFFLNVIENYIKYIYSSQYSHLMRISSLDKYYTVLYISVGESWGKLLK